VSSILMGMNTRGAGGSGNDASIHSKIGIKFKTFLGNADLLSLQIWFLLWWIRTHNGEAKITKSEWAVTSKQVLSQTTNSDCRHHHHGLSTIRERDVRIWFQSN
jgi:hypothetical protein